MQIDYGMIEQAAIGEVSLGEKSEVLLPFNTEAEFYVHCQALLENSQHPAVLVFASKQLYTLIQVDSPIWDLPHYEAIMDWISRFCALKNDLLFQQQFSESHRKLIISSLGQVYTYIIYKLWTPSLSFSFWVEKIAKSLPCDTPGQRCLRNIFFSAVMTNLNEYQIIKSKITSDRSDTSLITLINEVLTRPENNEDLIYESVNLVFTIFEFFKKPLPESSVTKQDEVSSELCDLTHTFHDTITDPRFILSLFNSIQKPSTLLGNPHGKPALIFERVLDVIFDLCCVKPTYFPRKENKASLLTPICNNMKIIMQNGLYQNDNFFAKIARILYKLALFLEKIEADVILIMTNPDESHPFLDLIQIASQMTIEKLNNSESFIHQNVAIVNTMNFWTKVASKSKQFLAKDINIMNIIFPLYSQYVKVFLQYTNEAPTEMIDILELEKGQICDAIQIIPILLKTEFVQLSSILGQYSAKTFESFKRCLLEAQGPTNELVSYDIQMALIVVLMSAGLRNQNSTKTFLDPADFENQFFNFLFEVMEFTSSSIQPILGLHVINLEYAIYIFANSFRRSTFANFAPRREEVTIFYHKIIQRLLLSLTLIDPTNPENKNLIRANLKSLQSIFDILSNNIPSTTKIFGILPETITTIEASSQFVVCVAEGKFPFAHSIFYKSEIIMMMKIATTIITRIPNMIPPFLQNIESKFATLCSQEANNAFKIFIYELIGMFSIQNEAFSIYFEWIAPKNLRMFAEVAVQCSQDYVVASAYLKFWYRLIAQDPQAKKPKISFPQHSPDGIILFEHISLVLVSYFNAVRATEVQNDLYREKLKPMKNAMFLMSDIMSAEYVMFGAFELYKVPTLINLLASFISAIEKIPFQDIFTYPKIGISFTQLINSLCKSHLMTIIGIREDFFDYLIKVINSGLFHMDESIIKRSVEAGTYLGSFLQANKANQSVANAIIRNKNQMAETLKEGFRLLFHNPKVILYNLVNLLKPFLSFVPEFEAFLKEQLQPQVPPEKAAEYEQLFLFLHSLLPEISSTEDFKNVITSLKKLAEEIHLKLPM